MVLLISCATGEKWNVIMRELAVNNETLALYNHDHQDNYCYESQSYESLLKEGPKECGTNMVYLYFIMFIVVI